MPDTADDYFPPVLLEVRDEWNTVTATVGPGGQYASLGAMHADPAWVERHGKKPEATS